MGNKAQNRGKSHKTQGVRFMSAKAFHESVIEVIQGSNCQKELRTILWAIRITKIPKNHEAIRQAVSEAGNRLANKVSDSGEKDFQEEIDETGAHLSREEGRVKQEAEAKKA
jgi:hypothetical protein